MMIKERLEKMYLRDKHSLQEIADDAHCSVNRVRYWMAKYGILTRSISDAVYIKNNPEGDPFALKKRMSRSDMVLLGIGLGLWWGEGYKRHQGAVRLGNSDPELIKAFVDFLTIICGVRKDKIRFGIQAFGDLDGRKVKRYWMGILGADAKQFLPKVVITPRRAKGSYINKVKHGVLTVYCINIKLRKVMDILMRKYANAGVH